MGCEMNRKGNQDTPIQDFNPNGPAICETWKMITKADERKLISFQCQCLRRIMKITWQQRMTNKHVLRREGETTVLQHWGGLQKDEERERDQRPLGEELLRGREREGRQGGRVGM